MLEVANIRVVTLSSSDRLSWLSGICDGRDMIEQNGVNRLLVNIDDGITRDKLRPEHITSLACLIESCARKGCLVQMETSKIIGERGAGIIRQKIAFSNISASQIAHIREYVQRFEQPC